MRLGKICHAVQNLICCLRHEYERTIISSVGRVSANLKANIFKLLKRMQKALSKMERPDTAHNYISAIRRTSSRIPSSNHPGITLIVLSYNRMRALRSLLRTLLRQELGDIGLELILCNNWPRIHLTESRFSRAGRLLRRFDNVKIFNSSYNWRCSVRYAIATLAKYETIMFLDDDMFLVDPYFIRYMFETFQTLRPVDILSCWTSLWVEWNDDYFGTVGMNFRNSQIKELTECDISGMGICMYNKRILRSKVLKRVTSPDFPKADDMAFSLIASLECGSRCYYLPSYSMVKFHKQYVKTALFSHAGHYDDLFVLYKSLLNEGYQPVLNRLSSSSANTNSPERRAEQALAVVKHPW